jgi:hypothetical protein
MNETAQIVLAVGVAVFLILIAAVGVIWAFRCHAASESFRFPPSLGLPVPLLLVGIALAERAF